MSSLQLPTSSIEATPEQYPQFFYPLTPILSLSHPLTSPPHRGCEHASDGARDDASALILRKGEEVGNIISESRCVERK
jgi:hypothetical protein